MHAKDLVLQIVGGVPQVSVRRLGRQAAYYAASHVLVKSMVLCQVMSNTNVACRLKLFTILTAWRVHDAWTAVMLLQQRLACPSTLAVLRTVWAHKNHDIGDQLIGHIGQLQP